MGKCYTSHPYIQTKTTAQTFVCNVIGCDHFEIPDHIKETTQKVKKQVLTVKDILNAVL